MLIYRQLPRSVTDLHNSLDNFKLSYRVSVDSCDHMYVYDLFSDSRIMNITRYAYHIELKEISNFIFH